MDRTAQNTYFTAPVALWHQLSGIALAACVATACGDEPTGAGGNHAGGDNQGGAVSGGSVSGGADAGGGMGGGFDEGVDLGGGVTVIPTKLEPGSSAKVIYRGSLSGGDVRLRYGFNGWNSTDGARSVEDDGNGNLDYYFDVAMTPLEDGSGLEVSIPLVDQARALHMAFSTPDGQSWDNNAGKDYNRGVRFPYLGPYLTWNASTPPESGVVVNFHTGHACQGSVEYGPTPELGSVIAEPSEGRSHRIVLTGLDPDALVHYRVACGTLVEEGVHAFRTAAAGDAFTFVALGDMQDAGEMGRWGATRASASTIATTASTRSSSRSTSRCSKITSASSTRATSTRRTGAKTISARRICGSAAPPAPTITTTTTSICAPIASTRTTTRRASTATTISPRSSPRSTVATEVSSTSTAPSSRHPSRRCSTCRHFCAGPA